MKTTRNGVLELLNDIRIWIADYQCDMVVIEEKLEVEEDVEEISLLERRHTLIEGKIEGYRKIERELSYLIYTTDK